jgi:hypothetical protein
MSPTQQFLTTDRAAAAGAGAVSAPPTPANDDDRYLVSLLESSKALQIALTALMARTAYADSSETQYIHVEQSMVNADQQKINAMVTAYLASQTVYKTISPADLAEIRAITDQLAGFSAQLDKASAIVNAVTNLLQKWQ